MKHSHLLTIIVVIALAAVCASAFAQLGGDAAAGAAPVVAPPAAGDAQAATPPQGHAGAQKAAGAAAAAPPAIAVSGNFVYVIQGRTLYQFAVDGLKLIAQAQLGPEPRDATARPARKGGKGKGKGILPAPDAGLPNATPGAAAPATGANGAAVVVPPAK